MEREVMALSAEWEDEVRTDYMMYFEG